LIQITSQIDKDAEHMDCGTRFYHLSSAPGAILIQSLMIAESQSAQPAEKRCTNLALTGGTAARLPVYHKQMTHRECIQFRLG